MKAFISEVVAEAVRTLQAISPVSVASVSAVTAGAAKDGNAAVTILFRGETTKAAYLSSYTPVDNHVVLLFSVGTQKVILGRIIGTP